jgi:RNA polymerase sigma factor (sigma-70 family)
MRQLEDRVRRILGLRKLGIPAHELDDLGQEVMTQVWRAVNRPGFDPTGGIWGFVEVVTARRCIDWLRARRAQVPLHDSLPDASDPVGTVLTLESRRLVAQALAALDEPCRELISLRIGGALSFREISEKLGRSEEALRVQMYRCVRAARGAFQRATAGGSSRGTAAS